MRLSDDEFTEIIPGLYQGSMVDPRDRNLRAEGFDAVFFCAKEWQPLERFFNVPVYYAPMWDDKLTDTEFDLAWRASAEVVKLMRSGKNVLVTCWEGRNRSGLVNALAIIALTGMSGKDAVRLIQSKRENALTNKSFVDVILKL